MLAVLMLLLFSLSAEADFLLPQECSSYQNQSDLFRDIQTTPLRVALHYRQVSYQYEDYTGDVSLIRYALAAPWGIYWKLTGQPQSLEQFKNSVMAEKPCALAFFQLPDRPGPQWQNYVRTPTDREITMIERLPIPWDQKEKLLTKLKSGQIYLSGRRQSLRVENFVKMMGQILRQEFWDTGLRPIVGRPHKWSAQVHALPRVDYQTVLRFPKLLTALTIGETSRYFSTGTDESLRQWLLPARVRSIEPSDLFRQAYRLNRGDVYLTLLSIENVLSRHWKENQREFLDQTLRLTPIVNQFGGDGNVFGTWYHLFGMILLGYTENSLLAQVVGEVETLGSQVLSHFAPEMGETEVNRLGGIIGARLRVSVANGDWNSIPMSLDYTKLHSYLDLTEDFSDRLLRIK